MILMTLKNDVAKPEIMEKEIDEAMRVVLCDIYRLTRVSLPTPFSA